jgi:hypothetical protein
MSMKVKRVTVYKDRVDDLKRDPRVQRHVHDRMERALDEARAIAPVDTGAYRDNLHLEDGEDGKVSLVSDKDYALAVEADTGTLSRSLDAAGGSGL